MSVTPPKNSVKPCYVKLEPITPQRNLNVSAELKQVIKERNILTTKTKRYVLNALDEITAQNNEEARRIKKEKVMSEILTTEENYLKQLDTIILYFLRPIKQREILKTNEIFEIFGHIHTIYNVNRELLTILKQNECSFAQAFNKIAPFFKLYSVYAGEFKNRLARLQVCSKTNLKFAKFLDDQESRPEVQSKLSSLLIAPIQRVPRYKLLLKQLFNLTAPDHPDYIVLSECLEKIEGAAGHINKIVEDQENTQRLLEFQRCLINTEPNVITPGRRLIKEGTIMKMSQQKQNNGHSEKLYAVLMNDIIIFCKFKKDKLKTNSLKCHTIYPLNKCKIIEILDKGCFKIICENEEIVLYCKQFEDTLNWIEEIRDNISSYVENRKTLKKENSSRGPVKRKGIKEYNEIGLSPGKPLKKRRVTILEEPIKMKNDSFQFTPPNGCLAETQNLTHEKKKEVFVFGANNTNRGFTFRMSNFFNSVKNSVRQFFGFE